MDENLIHFSFQTEENVTKNESIVTSYLTFAPVPEDDRTVLKCRGDNPVLGIGLEDTFQLNVICK